MAMMFRVAAAVMFSSIVLAQNAPHAEVAAARSPLTLARYIGAHEDNADWDGFWRALERPAPTLMYPLCGAPTIFSCVTETVMLPRYDQAILIIQSEGLRADDLFLRYIQEADGSWRFAGFHLAVAGGTYPRRHEISQLDGKPFLKIASDLSQVGGTLGENIEEWFDLSEPNFEPVFSFTADGSITPFCLAVGQEITAQAVPSSNLSGTRRSS